MSDHVDGDVAPAAGAVLTTAQAVGMAEFIAAGGRCVQQDGEWLSRTILAWEPVVRAAEAQADMPEHFDVYQSAAGYAWAGACERTEAAVRSMRAALGGGA